MFFRSRKPAPPPSDSSSSPTSLSSNEFDLDRFLKAQQEDFARASAELVNGQKTSCWIWYIFPQTITNRKSATAKFYAIPSLREAQAYLEHPVLGPRLIELTRIVISHAPRKIEEIMGSEVDAEKFLSSMTLFALVPKTDAVFQQAIDVFYRGEKCRWTIERLGVS
jgi:uncharacterized protein (DUF1810 family)